MIDRTQFGDADPRWSETEHGGHYLASILGTALAIVAILLLAGVT